MVFPTGPAGGAPNQSKKPVHRFITIDEQVFLIWLSRLLLLYFYLILLNFSSDEFESNGWCDGDVSIDITDFKVDFDMAVIVQGCAGFVQGHLFSVRLEGDRRQALLVGDPDFSLQEG